MEQHLVNTLFVIPDIGGYTRFMVHNRKDPERSLTVVKNLMEAMIRQERMPLSIAEVEGDALFLYAVKQNELQWMLEKETISATVENFFTAFYAELHRLMTDRVCACGVCGTIEDLGIKAIVHYGSAVVGTIGGFRTLNGVDVIIAHRLLKNSLQGDYLLVTKAAFEECAFPDRARFVPHREHYDDIGDVDGYVCVPTPLPRAA